jgi:hypothetical protein
LIRAQLQDGSVVEISGASLKWVAAWVAGKKGRKLLPGAVIRVQAQPKKQWRLAQLPEIESALVALDPRNGAITALVGGFDFSRTKFNRVTQAWRQPGSSFKPFIYSAALEKGYTPATLIENTPFTLTAEETGNDAWEPKNYDGNTSEMERMRTALTKSLNLVSVRILQGPCKTSLAELPDELCQQAEGLMTLRMAVPADQIARFPKLKVVIRMGVGYDRVDRAACAARGIKVCNVPDYGTSEVADHAVTLMVSLARGHDPRDFALFAFGGAGPLHACALARELGIPRVLIPARPGLTNALGCAVADLRHDYVRTVNVALSREELPCTGCQSAWKNMFGHFFDKCFYGDSKCLELLFANDSLKFKQAIDEVLK